MKIRFYIDKESGLPHIYRHEVREETEDEAVAEDEAAWEDATQTFVEVPNELVPAVRKLLAKKVA